VPWLGNGLLLSTGKKWFNKRKTITPTFHFKILEQFTEVFERQGNVLIQKLMKNADGKEFNIYNFVTLFALDVVSGKF
jgi:cytochrome P450 family 4